MTSAQEVRAMALRRSMCERFVACNLDELIVLELQLTRMELGRKQYGPLDLSKPRDWAKEEAEEHVDAAFYRACGVLSQRAAEEAAALGVTVDDIAEWEGNLTRASAMPARIAFEDIAELEPYAEYDQVVS